MRKEKSEKKSGAVWLDRNLLESPYYYGLCVTEKAFHAELKRLKIPKRKWPEYLKSTRAAATVHFFEKDGGQKLCCIVCAGQPKDRTMEEIYATLVHEAVHIWQQVKVVIGESCPGDEEEAYAIQRISLELMAAYRDLTKK